MPNYKRYSVVEPWLLDRTFEHEEDDVRTFVVVEVADLKDKRNGDVFTAGAWRVRFTRLAGEEVQKPPYKTKTWFGETAWNSAERYALDSIFALRNGKDVPS